MRSAQGLYSFFDKERYDVYIVDVKDTDWHVNFDNGDIAKIDRNDFSFMKVRLCLYHHPRYSGRERTDARLFRPYQTAVFNKQCSR